MRFHCQSQDGCRHPLCLLLERSFMACDKACLPQLVALAAALQLNGCINDCLAMRQLLTQHFGFAEGDITMMLDTDASTTSPTGANIKVQPAWAGPPSAAGD